MNNSWVGDLLGYEEWIGVRGNFWDLPVDGRGANSMAYWVRHEFARYFLLMNENSNSPGGHGLQDWDRTIDFLIDVRAPEILNDIVEEWPNGKEYGNGCDWAAPDTN
jgi:hypothetical protein